MKRAQILLIFLVLFGWARIFAQENPVPAEKWMRLENDDKDFSVALPTNAVIDAEERKYGQRFKAVALQNGVEMELQITSNKNVKDRLINIQPLDFNKLVSFKVGDFLILKSEPRSPIKKFYNRFWIIKKETLYLLTVAAQTGREKEVARFLASFTVAGKPFVALKEKTNFPEETVAISDLRTSAEVAEAFARKLEKNKIKVTYEATSDDADDLETEGLTRKAVILERPLPKIELGFGGGISANGRFNIKLKVNFLAHGQIGDMTVLSVVNKEISKACVEAAQKIRFVPAQLNGKNVDSVRIVDYHVQLFSGPGMVRQ